MLALACNAVGSVGRPAVADVRPAGAISLMA
jgi:hypothetical protein